MKPPAPYAAVASTRLPAGRPAAEELAWLAELYTTLAEALALETATPAWLGLKGREWPVWEAASSLAGGYDWPALGQAVAALAEVGRAPAAARRQQGLALFHGQAVSPRQEHAPLRLYESQHLNGRLLGPQSFALRALYRRAGLELAGAELPDHAAVELEFLAFLAEREGEADGREARQWRLARRRFVQEHAGRWLPQVGRHLAAAEDQAWSALGQLLLAALHPPGRNGRARRLPASARALPRIRRTEACNLCSFCVQVCPTHALAMDEDERLTRLVLQPELCIACRKCEQVCQDKAIDLASGTGGNMPASPLVLRRSPRALCPRCGRPTVSQAEIAAVVARLGSHPAWLDTCLDCR